MQVTTLFVLIASQRRPYSWFSFDAASLLRIFSCKPCFEIYTYKETITATDSLNTFVLLNHKVSFVLDGGVIVGVSVQVRTTEEFAV